MPGPDLYAVLGVAPDATTEEITRAYRRLVRRYHPDTRDSRAGETIADAALARVIAAYDVLRDPERRARYDRRQRATPRAAPVDVAVRWVPPRTESSISQPPIKAGPVRWQRPRMDP